MTSPTTTVFGSIEDREGRMITVCSDRRGLRLLHHSDVIAELDDEAIRSLLTYLNLYGELAAAGSVHVALPMEMVDRFMRHSAALHSVASNGCLCDSALAKRVLLDA